MRKGLMVVAASAVALVASACSGGGGGGGNGSGPGSDALANMGPGSFATTSDAVSFATLASAAQVFAFAYAPAGAASAGFDPNCPVITGTSPNQTITGGCTDTSGNTYGGTIVMSQTKITYQDWTNAYVDSCGGATFNNTLAVNGTLAFSPSGTTGASFNANLAADIAGADDACVQRTVTYAVAYSGNLANTGADTDGDGIPDDTTFNGSGTVGVDSTTVGGGGKVDASTSDEVTNSNTCNYEALSGSTTISADGHQAVFTYDGATDCSQDSTVTWTYDGADQGTLSGVACDVGGLDQRGATGAIAIGALLLSLLALRRWGQPVEE